MSIKNDPPHLPPRACRVDTHYKLNSLKWTIFLIVVAFVSGTAAALSTVAWLAPVFIQSDSYYPATRDMKLSSLSQPDIIFQHQVNQKVLKIYDKNKKITKTFYDQDSLVFNSAILSSDGWAVAYYPAYVVGSEKNWEAIDSQGLYYVVEKVVYDSVSELLYLKVSGQGFRINSFSAWSDLAIGHSYWNLEKNGWQEVSLDDLQLVGKNKSYSIWRSQYSYSFWQEIEVGSLLFNSQGDLVGIVDKDNFLRPAWLIEGRVSSLLEIGQITYTGLPWRGYIISGVEKDDKWKKLSGFYVTESNTKMTTSTVGVGDVILEINGNLIEENFLAAQLFSASDTMTVTVWRDGGEVEVEVSKVKVF